MSNWQYANLTPTQQFRSCNALARELKLYTAPNGKLLVSAAPVAELKALRKDSLEIGQISLGEKTVRQLPEKAENGTFELEFTLHPEKATTCGVKLLNDKGEMVNIYYDAKQQRIVMDRAQSGITDFGKNVAPHHLDNAESLKRYETLTVNYHNAFALGTWAPLFNDKDNAHKVSIYVDRSSVELFVDGGRVAMTNLVFPTKPYNQLQFYAEGGQARVSDAKVYGLAL